jgi:hypothetical protein
MIGQVPTPAQVQTVQQDNPFANLSQMQKALMMSMPQEQLSKSMSDVIAASQEFGNPQNMMIDNKPVVVQYNKRGDPRIVSGAQPYEAMPTDIKSLEYILGSRLGGTGAAGMAQLGDYRAKSAPSTVVKLPPGPSSFATGAGTAGANRLQQATEAANSANDTLRNIDNIAPALNSAVLGPAADYRTAMLRIGQQLNIAGPNAEMTLQNTRQVVQGLAQSELTAAAGMKGQGAITENERALIKRVAAGDQTMLASELRTGMAAMQKLANQRIKEHEFIYANASKIKGFDEVAPLFQVMPYTSQVNLSSDLNMGNAIDEALKRKKKDGTN